MHISVVTWNIHKCIGGVDRRYQPERVIEVLQHHAPDIVFLQEVDEGARRSRGDRQVDLISEALGLRHIVYTPTHRLRKQGHYGNAIASRWPLYDVHDLDLTISWRKKRGAIWARCRVRHHRATRTVMLCNLHLGLAGSERTRQLTRFIASRPFARVHQQTPIVLGGDFNDVTGRLGTRLLEPAGFSRAGSRVNTFPAALPMRPLDAIYTRGQVGAEYCAPSRTELARRASDHLPLVARLKVTCG